MQLQVGYNRPKIKCLKIEFMLTYNEVLNQVQQLSISEQLRLSEELKNLLNQGVEVEGDLEVIPAEEIAESEAAWQDYLAGRDRGNSLKELELELFGRELN
jgi:hypothetical protein